MFNRSSSLRGQPKRQLDFLHLERYGKHGIDHGDTCHHFRLRKHQVTYSPKSVSRWRAQWIKNGTTAKRKAFARNCFRGCAMNDCIGAVLYRAAVPLIPIKKGRGFNRLDESEIAQTFLSIKYLEARGLHGGD